MAYVAKQLPEDENNYLAQQGQTTPVPESTGGSVGGGDEAPAAPPNVGTPTQFGSSASKLSDYLKANAPQVEQQGETIAGKVRDQYGQVKAGIDTALQGFNQNVAAGYEAPNQDLVQEAAANPTAFAQDPAKVAAFQKQRTDAYKGPEDFTATDPYAKTSREVSDAVADADLFKSPSGLQTYLRNTAPGGNYTKGMGTLDAALLAGTPGAITKIREAAAPFQGLSGYLSNSANAAKQGVTQARDAAAQAVKGVEDAFRGEGGVIPSFVESLKTPTNWDYSEGVPAQKARAINTILGEQAPYESFIAQALGIAPTPGNQELIATTGRIFSDLERSQAEGADPQAISAYISAVLQSLMLNAER